jgi:dienelactone hydrolase
MGHPAGSRIRKDEVVGMKRIGMTVVVFLGICVAVRAQGTVPLDANKVFAYDASKPLNYREGNTETLRGGERVVEISYDSAKIGRVPGYLVVPRGKGPFAAIIYMHWGQGNKGEFLSEAVDTAARGLAVSIMIDAPYWRPDVPPPAKDKEAEAERDGYIQMVVDLRRAVDVLRTRKDVDPNRIGYIGHSLGATWGGPLAAVEKRIRVFVLMGGLPKVPPDWDDDSFYARVQRSSTPRAEFDKEVAVMKSYAPENFVANTGPAKVYFQWAKYDMFISQLSAEEYFKAVGGPKEQRWYLTSHEFNDTASRGDRMDWLMQVIGPYGQVISR